MAVSGSPKKVAVSRRTEDVIPNTGSHRPFDKSLLSNIICSPKNKESYDKFK
jgi:hypothetical protein